jgi:hypothetical protein
MKFLCLKCDNFMDYQAQEQVDALRLGITFGCGQCGYKFAMVTNPGETQLVTGLGVKIGGRTVAPEPLEFTREALKSGDSAEPMKVDMGKCPFPAMLAGGPAAGAQQPETAGSTLPWTSSAEQRLSNVPSFVRALARVGIEQYARDKGYAQIDDTVMQEYREKVGM